MCYSAQLIQMARKFSHQLGIRLDYDGTEGAEFGEPILSYLPDDFGRLFGFVCFSSVTSDVSTPARSKSSS
jgi:hypothetical protein